MIEHRQEALPEVSEVVEMEPVEDVEVEVLEDIPEEEVEAEGGLRPDVAAMTDEMVVEVLQTEISGRAEAEDRPFGEVLAELSQQPDGTALTNVRGMQKNVDLARATLSALYDAQDGGGE